MLKSKMFRFACAFLLLAAARFVTVQPFARSGRDVTNRVSGICESASLGTITSLPPSTINFVHIPKTGGTTIENVFKETWNISVGRHGITYETDRSECNTWHRPPMRKVPRSFVVVREPLERLESEFKWGHKFYKDYQRFPLSLEGFESWIQFTLARAKYEPEITDCHFLPQWTYARRVESIVRFECVDVLLSALSRTYDSHKTSVIANVAQAHTAWAVRASTRTRELTREFFQDDYRHLQEYFTK